MKRLAFFAAVALAFLAGLTVDHAVAAAARPGTYRSLDVFARALAVIQGGYVDQVDDRELVQGAIEGMVARLDAHSAYLRPEVFKAMREETAGEFDGVGVEVARAPGGLTVVSPVADSPGERAGLRPGDRILSIDGASTADMSVPEATRRMKGAVGSRVELELMRDGFTAPQRLALVRERVRTRSVEWRVLDADRRLLYVRVKSFQDRTDAYLAKALGEGREALKGELRGLVLDLRNNPGGLVEQAVLVADRFLPRGVIVSTEGRDRESVEVRRAHEGGTEPAYPIILLVNRGTASASEIVAGALQDQGRAVIMGTQTFGKGSVQELIPLDDGSGLKLTVARYYTPRHRSIQELGITPDVRVGEAAPAARADDQPAERDLDRHLRNPEPAVATPAQPPAEATDHQLRTALDYLRAADILRNPGAPADGAATRRD
ncbi:MAG: S41 family peptidase [Anaeromyxobacter sp.]